MRFLRLHFKLLKKCLEENKSNMLHFKFVCNSVNKKHVITFNFIAFIIYL